MINATLLSRCRSIEQCKIIKMYLFIYCCYKALTITYITQINSNKEHLLKSQRTVLEDREHLIKVNTNIQ